MYQKPVPEMTPHAFVTGCGHSTPLGSMTGTGASKPLSRRHGAAACSGPVTNAMSFKDRMERHPQR